MNSKRCSETGRFTSSDHRFTGVGGDISKCGIYKITNLINGKFYIGSTCQSFKKRWQKHLQAISKYQHPNPHLQNSINKHGLNNFSFEILEYTERDKKVTIERESHYIQTLNPDYNLGSPKAIGAECMFSKEVCLEIIKRRVNGESYKNLIRDYGTTKVTLSKIVSGRYYNSKDIDLTLLKKCAEVSKYFVKKAQLKINNANKKLTVEQAGQARWLCQQTNERKKIADHFGINTGTLHGLHIGRNYKEVLPIPCEHLIDLLGLRAGIEKDIITGKMKWVFSNSNLKRRQVADLFGVSMNRVNNAYYGWSGKISAHKHIKPIPCPELLEIINTPQV